MPADKFFDFDSKELVTGEHCTRLRCYYDIVSDPGEIMAIENLDDGDKEIPFLLLPVDDQVYIVERIRDMVIDRIPDPRPDIDEEYEKGLDQKRDRNGR